MGFFGFFKTKITPYAFVETQLDKIFSETFIETETEAFVRLSKNNSTLQSISLDKYLKERQNVIYNLLQIAWDRTIPYSIFIKYSRIMSDDPRIEAMDTEIYSCSLSRAQEAGIDTFGFISSIFIAQITSQALEDSKLYERYKSDFTKHYISFEALIKQYKYIN